MLELVNVNKIYKNNYTALRNINLKINEGEFIVLLGSSGAGKSTLLQCINKLIEPSKGKVLYKGKHIHTKSDLKNIRKDIGMIFQSFNLVNRLSVLDNVLCGRLAYNNTIKSCLKKFPEKDILIAKKAIKQVGLESKIYSRADALSGGQRQRVGIARALAQEPSIILADEPVASLDPIVSIQILDILKEINKKNNITVILSLHNTELALKYGERIIGLKDGTIVLDKNKTDVSIGNISYIYGGNNKIE